MSTTPRRFAATSSPAWTGGSTSSWRTPRTCATPRAACTATAAGSSARSFSLRIAREASERLAPGGTLLLYTGAAVVEGRDVFLDAVTPLLRERGLPFHYEELDPDVFGEELDRPGYAAVERIAAVLLTLSRSRSSA